MPDGDFKQHLDDFKNLEMYKCAREISHTHLEILHNLEILILKILEIKLNFPIFRDTKNSREVM